MGGRTFDGSPLTPGVNVDSVDIDSGLRMAKSIGYDSGTDEMVVVYALQRHARGEEEGAWQTMRSAFGSQDFVSWRMILAAAMAPDDRCNQGRGLNDGSAQQ